MDGRLLAADETFEVAVHRWDAEEITGRGGPVDGELAADAVAQTFDVMVPARRAWREAPGGKGESYGSRRTDGPGAWTVRFDGDAVVHVPEAAPCDVRLSGTASDLTLFLRGRIAADRLEVSGEEALLDRYFTLAPAI